MENWEFMLRLEIEKAERTVIELKAVLAKIKSGEIKMEKEYKSCPYCKKQTMFVTYKNIAFGYGYYYCESCCKGFSHILL